MQHQNKGKQEEDSARQTHHPADLNINRLHPGRKSSDTLKSLKDGDESEGVKGKSREFRQPISRKICIQYLFFDESIICNKALADD